MIFNLLYILIFYFSYFHRYTLHLLGCKVTKKKSNKQDFQGVIYQAKKGERTLRTFSLASELIVLNLRSMTLQERNDPMGAAIRDYFTTGRCGRLRVLSPQFEEDELPVPLLFRAETEMPPLERLALDKARGRVLDTGAGAGCHTLALQQRGLDVTAIDISPGAVRTMRRRGVEDARLCDFFEDDFGGPFDTVLMLMNGIGICGRLERLPFFFTRINRLLAPGGQVLADSSDLVYLFEDEEIPAERYYGEVGYRMQYGKVRSGHFDWLYVDFLTLAHHASAAGFRAELLHKGSHYDYLARLTRA